MPFCAVFSAIIKNCAVASLHTAALLVCGMLLLICVWRRSFTVQCWFCNGLLNVSWRKRNCFTCVHCRQYNGFSPDGGYNKVIDEQHQMNSTAQYATMGTLRLASNILCNKCTENQSLINKKIADFEPLNENDWETEFVMYKRSLEREHGLCTDCLRKSKARINGINRKLYPGLVEWLCSTRRLSNKLLEERGPGLHSSGASLDSFPHRPLLPRWLHRLVRLSCLLCFIFLTFGPIASALVARFCTVSTKPQKTWATKLLTLFWPKSLFVTSQFCPCLINISPIFALPQGGKLWCVILFFILQGILTGLDGLSYNHSLKSRPDNYDQIVANPFVLLFDLSLLVFAGNTLINVTAAMITTGASLNSPYAQLQSRYAYVIGISASLILLVCASVYGLKIWLSFCSSDWSNQKQKLTECWPDHLKSRSNSPSCASRYSPSSVLPDTIPDSADRIMPCNIQRNFSSMSISTLPFSKVCGERSPTFKSTINFRPSLLSKMDGVKEINSPLSDNRTVFSCPTAFNKSMSAISSKFTDLKEFTLSDSENEFDNNSFVTSVSNFKRCQTPQSLSSSPSVGSWQSGRASDKQPSRRRRRHRRKGILRFLLTLLFGQLDTWTDLVSELTYLLNALLLASIIYGIVRILFCLMQI